MGHLKLVAVDVVDPAEFAIVGADEPTAQLLADLERGWGLDRDLAVRAAHCIRELVHQREQAAALMLDSSALLKAALGRLHALKALI
jgi:hypothetical protein